MFDKGALVWTDAKCTCGHGGRLRVVLAVVLLLALQFQLASAHDFKVLVFSKTAGFRHASITNGIEAIRELGTNNNFTVDATEDASYNFV